MPDAFTSEQAEYPEASPYSRHIAALDGIRALAIIGVMSSHLFPGTPRSALTGAIQGVMAFGATGVDLFFVLSGFLITGILYDSLKERSYFRKFYARRALRIFPLYYGVLAIFALQGLFLGIHFRRELLSMAFYMQNTSLISYPASAHPGDPQLPLKHFWSLAIEEQFYLVWPLVVFLVRDRNRLLILCAAAMLLCPVLRWILVAHGVSYDFIHMNTLCRADSLLAGGGLALLLRGRAHDTVLQIASRVFVGGLMLVAAFRLLPLLPATVGHIVQIGIFNNAAWYSALAITYTAGIAMCLSPGFAGRLCSLRPLRWVGKYSYGIYVFHLILFSYLQIPLRNLVLTHITSSKGVNILLSGITVVVLTFACSYLSYNFYERHFLKLKRYFDYRRHPDTVAQAGSVV